MRFGLAVVLSIVVVACNPPTAPTALTTATQPSSRTAPVAVAPSASHRLTHGPCDGPAARECLTRYNDTKSADVHAGVRIEDIAAAYIAGGVDDATHLDLLKALSDSGEPAAVRPLALAFDECAAGRHYDEMRFAARGILRFAELERPVDPSLAASLWSCFAAFRPSKNTASINVVRDLQAAVLATRDASFGPKAVEMLAAPVTDPRDPAEGMDELQFWQATAVRVIGDLRYAAGVRPLVKATLTPTKSDLSFPLRLALTRMPKDAEPLLIAALNGSDPELAALASAYPSKAWVPRVAEPLAYISRPAGRAAILAALEKADNDENRAILATELTHFPSEPTTVKAFLAAYRKVPADATVPLMGGANARALMAQSAASFFDPSLTKWLLDANAGARGEASDAMVPAALPSAIKLMTNAGSRAVGNAVRVVPGKAIEKDMYASALAVLDHCKKDTACYLLALDAPVPTTPPSARMGHVKAAWMAAIYGDSATRASLVAKLASTQDSSVRLAMANAIDHLSPQGDVATAEKLEAVVESDRKAGVHAATDEIYRIAQKLRSRVP